VSFVWSAVLVGAYAAGVEVLMRRSRLPRVLVLRDAAVAASREMPVVPGGVPLPVER
jgi:hypothetical protein